MSSAVRWGILGTGSIARKFAAGLAALEDAELAAVGSRSQRSADKFGREFHIARRHGSYEALAADAGVDAVYVATPHVCHKENTLLCLNGGLAVLCEKPLALNAAEAGAMIACARERNVFLMEAMWTHFFPAMAKVRELIAKREIGDVRMVTADFCFRSGWKPEGRLLNPALGGGGLLDVGVYTVAFAHMVFGGPPPRISSMAHIGETGVDEQAAAILGYENGGLAVLKCAVRTSTPHGAMVYGTDGWIEIPPLFWQPDRIVLCRDGKKKELAFERLGNGYSFEAAEVNRCLRKGRTESEIMPLAKSLSIMRTLDRIREQWGLRYPGEARTAEHGEASAERGPDHEVR